MATSTVINYSEVVSGSASAYDSYTQANPNFSSDPLSQAAFGSGVATALAAFAGIVSKNPFVSGLACYARNSWYTHWTGCPCL